MIENCPCSSGKTYIDCCKSLHEGKIVAQNALQLMKSRYSAYAMNNPDYIILTTPPASPKYLQKKFSWKRSISQFSRRFSFNQLEILDFNENNNGATVTFTAHLSEKDHDATFTEKSYFEKVKGRWFYLTGHVEKGYAPNLSSKKSLNILPLAYYGDPVLTKNASPVEKITSDIKKLVEDMVETMDLFDGIGLAAPQVHHSIRLFVIRTPIANNDDTKLGHVKVFINPTIKIQSKKKKKSLEGCLSIPSLEAEIERPCEITVEYTNLKGELITDQFSGLEARVIMHENDHINGILFIDHLDEVKKNKINPFLNHLQFRIHQ